jgi:hypothetical protein
MGSKTLQSCILDFTKYLQKSQNLAYDPIFKVQELSYEIITYMIIDNHDENPKRIWPHIVTYLE